MTIKNSNLPINPPEDTSEVFPYGKADMRLMIIKTHTDYKLITQRLQEKQALIKPRNTPDNPSNN